MGRRAPLWRPLLMAGIGYAYWLGRQSSARLEARSPFTYTILAAVIVGCAVATWGIQRWRGRRWPWLVEMFVMVGLLFAAGLVLNVLFPPPGAESARVWSPTTANGHGAGYE